MTIDISHHQKLRCQGRGSFQDMLTRSLIILDDDVPGYTKYEQFANIGAGFHGGNVVVDDIGCFGRSYLSYLLDAGLHPANMWSAGIEGLSGTLRKILDDRKMCDELSMYVQEHDVQFLLPFLPTENAVSLSDVLGVSLLCPAEITYRWNSKYYAKEMAREAGVRVLDAVESGDFPVIIKDDFACGGFGNVIVRSEDAYRLELEKRSVSGRHLVVERFKENASAYCLLADIGSEAVISGLSEQLTYAGCSYRGSRWPPLCTEETALQIMQDGGRIAEKMRAQGYRGPAGLDFLVDEDGPVFLEVNARVNNSHFLYHVLQKAGPGAAVARMRNVYPKNGFADMDAVLMCIDGDDLFSEGSDRGVFVYYPEKGAGPFLRIFSVIMIERSAEELGLLEKKYGGRLS